MPPSEFLRTLRKTQEQRTKDFLGTLFKPGFRGLTFNKIIYAIAPIFQTGK